MLDKSPLLDHGRGPPICNRSVLPSTKKEKTKEWSWMTGRVNPRFWKLIKRCETCDQLYFRAAGPSDPFEPPSVPPFWLLKGSRICHPKTWKVAYFCCRKGDPFHGLRVGLLGIRIILSYLKKTKAADIRETLKTERLPFTKGNLHLFYIRKGTCTSKGPLCLPNRSVMSNSLRPHGL